MQRMNMLYSDLYNVLLQLFVILAISRLISHLRRLIFLWTTYKQNKEEILKTKSQCVDLERKNRLLQEEIESISTKMVTSDQAAAEAGKSYEEDMKRLSSENEIYKSQIPHFEKKIQQLSNTTKKEVEIKNNVINYLRAANEKLVAAEEENSQTKSQCVDLESKNRLLQEEIESISSKMMTSDQATAEAGKSYEEDMKRLSSENEIYKSQISHLEKKIQQLSNTTKKEVEIKNNVINYLRAANEKLVAAEEENSQTKSQCVDLERKNRLLQEEIESISTKMVTSDQAAAEAGKSYEEDMKRLSNEIELLRCEIANTAVNKQKLTKTIQEQESMTNLLSNYLRAAHEKLAASEEEILKTKTQCVDLETKNHLLQEEIESISTKTVTSDQAAAEAGKSYEEDMKRLSNEIELLRCEIANTAVNKQKLTKTIQEQESMTNLLSNYLRAAHEKLAASEEEILKTKTQCVDLERKNRLLQEEIESISTKMVTSDQAGAEAGKSYEEDMKRLRTENELYCSQLENTAEKIEKLTNKIQEQEIIKNDLIKYLKKKKKKNGGNESQLDQLPESSS